jgi:predicted ester cyclase
MTTNDTANPAHVSRRKIIAGAPIVAAGLVGGGIALAQAPISETATGQVSGTHITLEIYKGYALDELDRWNAVIHPDVIANSPAGRDTVGLETLKRFNKAFLTAFRPRTDLIDHYVVGDRGAVTVNLHWKHDGGPFNGIAPTGKSGTSVETFLLRIKDGLVTHWDVADRSLDLANYLHDQGMKLPTFVELPALIRGTALR